MNSHIILRPSASAITRPRILSGSGISSLTPSFPSILPPSLFPLLCTHNFCLLPSPIKCVSHRCKTCYVSQRNTCNNHVLQVSTFFLKKKADAKMQWKTVLHVTNMHLFLELCGVLSFLYLHARYHLTVARRLCCKLVSDFFQRGGC